MRLRGRVQVGENPVVHLLAVVFQALVVRSLMDVDLRAVRRSQNGQKSMKARRRREFLKLGDPLPVVIPTVNEAEIGGVCSVSTTLLTLCVRHIRVEAHLGVENSVALVREVFLVMNSAVTIFELVCDMEAAEFTPECFQIFSLKAIGKIEAGAVKAHKAINIP